MATRNGISALFTISSSLKSSLRSLPTLMAVVDSCSQGVCSAQEKKTFSTSLQTHDEMNLADEKVRAMSTVTKPSVEVPSTFNVLEKPVTEPYKVDPENVFAIVELSGTQYKVTPDDVIITEKLNGVDINHTIRLNKVLMLGSEKETIIGRPYIPGAEVVAAIEEQFLDGKVIVFKKRRRKNSRRTNGHRQPLTTLRILEISGM